MIVCKNCGAQLDIKNKYCPYCGTLNEEAIEHIEKVESFQKDYEETKKKVFSNVRTFSKGYKYLICLIVIMISIFIVLFIGTKSYDIGYLYKENYYNKNKEAIHLKIDSLIENKEYTKLGLYLNELEYFGRIKGLDKYREVSYILHDYNNVKSFTLKYIDGVVNENDDILSRVSSSISDFYTNYSRERNDIIDNIVLEIDDFLKAYIHLSDEDIKMIKEDPSNTKISGLLHERVGNIYE